MICMSTLSKTDEILSRTVLLVGDDIQKLINSHVAVFGLGGVGGYVCEILARAGVGTITIVDFDKVDVTNINRQIIALHSTVGQNKTDAILARIKDINPNIVVKVINDKLTQDNIDMFFSNKYDFVADCIDMVDSKVALIEACKDRDIRILSAMGAGNRVGVPNFEVKDIFDTYNDGLAKILRKKLRLKNINSALCVHSIELPRKVNNTLGVRAIGSISYYPAMCGVYMGAVIINKLLEDKLC